MILFVFFFVISGTSFIKSYIGEFRFGNANMLKSRSDYFISRIIHLSVNNIVLYCVELNERTDGYYDQTLNVYLYTNSNSGILKTRFNSCLLFFPGFPIAVS